ncbi:hypothetical protein A4A49_60547 [Nicotiana attenuata]|uniref:TF-B3 domain-containing protein n=1 Tax=Nicotiana attenuata TaxID=49451 RepID=A0A1J6ICL2_NICAT|nr:hypothetical protein A4A49_60547 [Nicotiana attenuata]
MKDSYIKQDYMHIPKRIYKHLPETYSTVLLQYGGKEWFVGMPLGNEDGSKTAGKNFVVKNDIKRGCFVKFELVEISQLFIFFKLQVKGQGTPEDPVEIN